MMDDQERPEAFYDPCAFAIDDGVAIALLADLQIRRAIARGEFDDLPGSGKPLDLPDRHDPEWWIKSLMERERVVLLPPSIQLRKDDSALDARLDEMSNEESVRREIDDFNQRVIRARYELPVGPPLITMPRDDDATVAAWADRRATRVKRLREQAHGETQVDRRRPRRVLRMLGWKR